MDRNDENELDRMIADRFSTFRPEGDWRPNLRRGLAVLRERRAKTNELRRRSVFLAAGIAAVTLPIMALPITRAFAARCVSACVKETAVVRDVLLGHDSGPAPVTTYIKAAERGTAPDFSLADESGRTIRLSDFRGKVVLLNFWATWCGPCSREIPWFIEFQHTNKARGLAVLGVAMDEAGWNSVKPYAEAKQIDYPLAIGNDHVAGLFGGLHTIPLTLIIDRAGRVAAVHTGLCQKDEYERDINAVLNEERAQAE